MNLLAIETSTSRGILALRRGDGHSEIEQTDPSIRHGRSLIPTLRDLLAKCQVQPRDLHGIGVGLGPGSFTGLRIGITAAKTLAYATGCPLVGIDTLKVIARNAPAEALRVVVLVDAQREEVFAAEFARVSPGSPLECRVPALIARTSDLLGELKSGTAVLGPALDRPSLRLPEGIPKCPPHANHPQGHHLLDVMSELIACDDSRRNAWLLEPAYIRRSAAEDKRDASVRPVATS